MNKKYTALLLSPISDGNLTPGVEDAMAAGSIINVNDGLIEIAPNFVGPCCGEWRAGCRMDCREAWQEGKVVGHWHAQRFAASRTLGFVSWMEKNAPNIKVVEQQNADWDRLKAKDLAEIWMKVHPDLKAIFCNNDTMALGVVEAVQAAGADILVVGVDGIGEAYESIRNGGLDATVDSFPFFKSIAAEASLRLLEVKNCLWSGPQALIDSTNVDTPATEIIGWTEPEFGTK